ncbi:DUF6233 domain-containing protein [Streptomyces sp. NPDC001222]
MSQAQALDALRQQVPTCTHCRPDTAWASRGGPAPETSRLI